MMNLHTPTVAALAILLPAVASGATVMDFSGVVSAYEISVSGYADDGTPYAFRQYFASGGAVGETFSASLSDDAGGFVALGPDTYWFDTAYAQPAGFAGADFSESGSGAYDGYYTRFHPAIGGFGGVLDTFAVDADGGEVDFTYTLSPSAPQPIAAFFSAVPEPSTWAVMLIGTAMVGAMVRRRRLAVA